MGGRRHRGSRDGGASLAAIEAAYRDGFERFATVAAAIVGSQAGARDAVQDGFAAAIRNRRQFRGEGSLEGWLWKTVVNEARSQRRRRFAAESAEARVFDRVAEGDWDERLEAGGVVGALVASLPQQQRLVVFLRYYADLTYQQIAEALELQPGTVAATLNRAHEVLRLRLEEVAR
jgi:RNA polymerase sigma-70 factor (ECF subfamily)